MTEREKIIDVLNKNFTQEVECTPVYTTTDGKELALPQELCNIFNDIVTQAVIPYFADALIAAGIGDTTNLIVENEVLQRALRSLAQLCAKGAKYYLQSDKAVKERERELYNEWIKQAKKELAEEKRDDPDNG